MRSLLTTAFLLGTLAFAIIILAAAFAFVIAADAGGWASTDVSVGPVVFVIFERSADMTSTTFGPGIMLAALLGGAVNAVAARLLRLRGSRLKR
mgnify:CR=1 FL=1